MIWIVDSALSFNCSSLIRPPVIQKWHKGGRQKQKGVLAHPERTIQLHYHPLTRMRMRFALRRFGRIEIGHITAGDNGPPAVAGQTQVAVTHCVLMVSNTRAATAVINRRLFSGTSAQDEVADSR